MVFLTAGGRQIKMFGSRFSWVVKTSKHAYGKPHRQRAEPTYFDRFDYGDALITALGEGGTSEFANGDLHQDGTFTLNPKWRRGLRVTANILKKATLGY